CLRETASCSFSGLFSSRCAFSPISANFLMSPNCSTNILASFRRFFCASGGLMWYTIIRSATVIGLPSATATTVSGAKGEGVWAQTVSPTPSMKIAIDFIRKVPSRGCPHCTTRGGNLRLLAAADLATLHLGAASARFQIGRSFLFSGVAHFDTVHHL